MKRAAAEMTDWFPPEVKPVRVGKYQCKFCMRMHWFNGRGWQAGKNTQERGFDQSFSWRGLASNPKRRKA